MGRPPAARRRRPAAGQRAGLGPAGPGARPLIRLWKAVVLVDLALGLGLGLGFLRWGLEVRRLRQELAEATRSSGASPVNLGPWTVNGVARAIIGNRDTLLATHETIPGVMPSMTMGFPAADPALLRGLAPGDSVRLTLRLDGERLVLVALSRRPGG